ncbi:MAG: TetR/AcrR family transcriptional regulator [Candidatus Atribacteria bacterium]|nr:TetR/AcrR family transcriptional regulator [Candidatus Atribacteria bacterium]
MGKREKILETAKKIFAEKSFFEATLEDISFLSGVKKSTIYYYFGSKLELLLEIVNVILEQAIESIATIPFSLSSQEILERIIDGYFAFFYQERDSILIFRRIAYDFFTHPEVFQELRQSWQRFRKVRENLGKRIGVLETKGGSKIDGPEIIRIVLSSINAYWIEEIAEGREIKLEDKEVFKDIFTAFIKVKENNDGKTKELVNS